MRLRGVFLSPPVTSRDRRRYVPAHDDATPDGAGGSPRAGWRALRGTNLADRPVSRRAHGAGPPALCCSSRSFSELAVSAWRPIRRFGLSFVWTSVWDPVAGIFGAAPMIFGTLASSLLALVIAVPLALGVAIYLTEFAPKWLRQPVASW